MYKELLSLGYMRDVPTEEVSWPWHLYLQGQRSTPIAAEKVGCRVPRAPHVLQVALHLTGREKKWLPLGAKLEQRARQVTALIVPRRSRASSFGLVCM